MPDDPDVACSADLSLDQARRRSAILQAIGDDWDPGQALAEEDRAYRMLYSDLDDEQRRAYDELVNAGVSTRRPDPSRLATVSALRPWLQLLRLQERSELRYSLAIFGC